MGDQASGVRRAGRAIACAGVALASGLLAPASAHASFTITDYPTPTQGSNPTGIALGSDGNVWFTEQGAATFAAIVLSSHSSAAMRWQSWSWSSFINTLERRILRLN